jgi:nickel-dependent lactate racemase
MHSFTLNVITNGRKEITVKKAGGRSCRPGHGD